MGKSPFNESTRRAYAACAQKAYADQPDKLADEPDNSLDAWISRHSAAKKLQENLRSVLDNTTNLTKREKDDVMRLNMIMVRQFGEDCGLE